MYLCREILGYSYPQIGRIFVKDHTTVIAACRVVAERISVDERVRQQVAHVRAMLVDDKPCETPTCPGCVRRETQLNELRQLLKSAVVMADAATRAA